MSRRGNSKSNYKPNCRPTLGDFEAAGLADGLAPLVVYGLVRTDPEVAWTRWGRLLLAQVGPPLRVLRKAGNLTLESLVQGLLCWLESEADPAPSFRPPSHKIASRIERGERLPTPEELITWVRATAASGTSPAIPLSLFTIEAAAVRLDDPSLDERRTSVACAVAREIGDWLLAEYVHGDRVAAVVSPEEERSIVTEADTKAYAALKAELTSWFPEDVVGGEEETDWSERAVDGRILWMADSIDGTICFANSLPSWCVAIAAGRWRAETGTLEPICAAVYNPPTGEMFWAGVGRGAQLTRSTALGPRATSLRASNVDGLTDSVIMSHLSASHTESMERFVDSGLLTALGRVSRRVLMVGSGQLALCYVASGRVQGYLVGRTNPWDVLAGKILLDEVRREGSSGGPLLTGYDFRPWALSSPGVVASCNTSIHQSLRALIQGLKG